MGPLKPDKYLDAEEVRRLLEYVRSQTSQRGMFNRVLIETLLGSGLRAEECCNLNIEDLHLSKKCLYVRNGKGGVARVVEISTPLCDLLAGFIVDRTGPVFVSERGSRLSYRSLWSKVKHIGISAGLPLHPHKLRHTYLTHLYHVAHDLRFVQDQAGHASPDTTAIYARTLSSARRSQAEQSIV